MGLDQIERITFTNDADNITGYISSPSGSEPSPAVVVIPAIAGINDYIKEVLVDLSNEGFFALALDLFSREGQAPDVSTPAKVGEALAKLPDPRTVSDVLAAVHYLKSRNDVKSEGIGVLGFCVGGTYAFLSACRTEDIKASVDFYGLIKYNELSENKPVSPITQTADLKAPLLAHFGEYDRLISANDIADLKKALEESQKPYELFTYAGAPHAFHEYFKPMAYRPVAARLAWQRSMTFLHWHLERVRRK